MMNQIGLSENNSYQRFFRHLNMSTPFDVRKRNRNKSGYCWRQPQLSYIGTHGAGLSSLESYLTCSLLKQGNDKNRLSSRLTMTTR